MGMPMLGTKAHDQSAGYAYRLKWYMGYSDKFSENQKPTL